MRVHSKSSICLLLIALIICGSLGRAIATAQSAIQGSLPFANRFEGTTVHHDDLEDFTLVALHRSFEEFPANSNLDVQFFIPELDRTTAQTIFVQAAELQDTSQHYFMHSKPITGFQAQAFYTFAPWPTADVIDRLRINSKNIGVLAGWQAPDASPVYSPVDVFRVGHNAVKNPYTFWFVVGRDVQRLEIFISSEKGQHVLPSLASQTCNLDIDPDCTLYPAASTQAVSIDFSSLPEGKYHVRFVGHFPRSSDKFAFDVQIYHAPSPNGRP
jgi:hypothetical protein